MKCKAERRGYEKVRITHNVGGWPIGFIGWHCNRRVYNDDCSKSWNHTIGASCEPYTTPHQIEVGGKYTSRDGNTWECIFVRDGVAWLNHGNMTAYRWKLDGTPICLGSMQDEYRIDLGPKVEVNSDEFYVRGNEVVLTYTVIDGVPDWSTAKVTPA